MKEEIKNKWLNKEEIEREIAKAEKECDKKGFEYHEIADGLFITSKGFGRWVILFEDKGPRLYHENYRVKKCKNDKPFMANYHRQAKTDGNTAEEMIRYISVHDSSASRKKDRTVFDKTARIEGKNLQTNNLAAH